VRCGRRGQFDEFNAFINSLNFEGAGPILSTTGATEVNHVSEAPFLASKSE
jgi:hypothetical protein